ncbi:MAG TPA: N-acetylmuramoyl-L-alanine amidase [Gemmatimonadaceae bacterium]|nr:N-acetylmuramoyl-L-alanine amidase [Gemmatimonadaceae bacterium]
MTTRMQRPLFLSIIAISAAIGCAPRGPAAPVPTPVTTAAVPTAPAPVPAPAGPALPPVPHVTQPLAIKVVYPTPNAVIPSKDSNFIFGSLGNGDAALTINGVPTPVWPNGAFMGWLPVPTAEHPQYDLVAAVGSDVARAALPIKLAPATTPVPDTVQRLAQPQYATLIKPTSYIQASDTDAVVTAYRLTGGSDRWFLLPDTRVKVLGYKGGNALVELDNTDTVYIEKPDLRMITADASTPVASPPQAIRTAKNFTVVPSAEYIDVTIPMSERPAHLVEEGANSITLTLYGTSGAAQTASLPATSYVTAVSSAPSGPKMKYTFALRGPAYGYLTVWKDSVLSIRVRRPPAIDVTDPLKGLTIAIDPGHPPVGATGPTGLWEPVPTLAVGFKVRDMLAARGVNVVMTRTDSLPVDLNLRGTIARRANAHAMVSIHLNALPDGQNPYTNQGTSTFYFYAQAEPLAKATHQALLTQLALPDKGAIKRNLAVIRPTWMPAILCEGAFIMMPDQEAAMRTDEYQMRYAKGIVDGLDAYFRSLGQALH